MAGIAFASGSGIDFAHVPVRSGSADPGSCRPAPMRISHPSDAAEREADQAAERVMRGERVHLAAAAAPALARKCAACEEEEREAAVEIRRKPLGEAALADRAPPAVAAALRAPGHPLDPAVRAYFEPRFGTSFADVRVHADAAADTAARSIDARAFTLGRRIAFATGEYAPATRAGQRLLAHELAHTLQPDAETVMRRDPPDLRLGSPAGALSPGVGITWSPSGGGITFGPIYPYVPLERLDTGEFLGHLIPYQRRVVAFGVDRPGESYMDLAANNTGRRSINIENMINLRRGRGTDYFRGEAEAGALFRDAPAGSLADEEAAPPRIRPMFSGMMAQEAVEGRTAPSLHFDLRHIPTMTPPLPRTSGDPEAHVPGLSARDYHSASEARQVFAHLAATAPGERRVTIVMQTENGITTFRPDSNVAEGARLPERFRRHLPNFEHPDRPSLAPVPSVRLPPPSLTRQMGGAGRQIGPQLVPGAAEGMVATEGLGLFLVSRGFGTFGTALLRGGANPLAGVTGAIVGPPAGSAAAGVARSAGASSAIANGVGIIGAMVAGAGAGVGVMVAGAAIVGATLSLPLLIGAAAVGALAAAFSFLGSR